MKKIILAIDGMTCSACSNGLEKYLNKQDGIIEASVNLVMANASISYDEKILSINDLNNFVKKAGFKSLGEFKEIKIENKRKKDKIIFIIFTILAIILMYIAMGHMIGLPTLDIIDMEKNPIIYSCCLGIFAIIYMIYGYDILKNGYKNFIHKIPNMDTLVSIGVISSFLYSLYNMILIFNGNVDVIHHLYFESVVMVIYFVKLGRYIDGISKDKTKEAIQSLVSITPQKARIKVNDEVKDVTIDEVKKNDIVICKPGEKIAVDGNVIKGNAHLDESFITGESKPVSKKIGDTVIAGSINYDGYIEFEAKKIGRDSTISEIVKLVVEATNTKAPISKIVDTISGYFVPIVMIIALIFFIIQLILGNSLADSLVVFVTVLVVACPCSLGLATPLAMVVSEGNCATKGILIKKSEILENARKVKTIVFDKTGTLTYGKLKLANFINYSEINDKELLQVICSIEARSNHPISKAFESYLNDNKLEKLEVDDFENILGLGIKGTINEDNYILGNRKILEKYNVKNKYEKDEEKLTKDGNTIVYLVKNKKIVGLAVLNDVIRDNVKDVISVLNNKNIETIMLTGDNEKTAKKIAKEIGITKVIANVLPNEKVKVIKNLKEEGKYVMMCGDGINDSPSLATADIGISIESGTDIAIDSADVILTNNDFSSILNLIKISERTMTIVKQNLFWAFFYNIIMIPIAAGLLKPLNIQINPMLASLAMVLSSLTVIINTLRLKRMKK